MARKRRSHRQSLEHFAQAVAIFAGSSTAFGIAVAIVLVWLASGPFFHYSETWQLVINTGTTIVTFLMVFLIQRSQNKESLAMQLKLNELVAAIEGASNRLVNVQDLGEDELQVLHKHYAALAALAKDAATLRESHSVDEAHARHKAKAR